MNNEAASIALYEKIIAKGAAQAEDAGFRWDNSHPTFKEAAQAFEDRDPAALEEIWTANFC